MRGEKQLLSRHRDRTGVVIAPDGSEIRELVATERASMVLCSLVPGHISRAVRHRSVEELWYFVRGRGQVWRWLGSTEEVLDVRPGVALNIPAGCHFQFRNTGTEPLEFVIVTVPPWPGDHEAERVDDHWPAP